MSKRAGTGMPNGAEKASKPAGQEGSQDKQARLLSSPNPGHFSMIRAYHLADLITLMNGFCGVMSIMSSMRYLISPRGQTADIWIALGFMPFGLF
ncbi:hypothetical protein KC352_g8697, partial [Hortaea werneckii]